MSKFPFLSTLVALSLLLSACSKNEEHSSSSESAESVEEANSMLSTNEFILTDLNKKQYIVKKGSEGFTLDGAEGKVVIFDIFATWCPPCQAEASHLSSLQKKHKDSLVVIGITVEQNVENEKLQTFKEKFDAHYPVVNSNENSRIIDAITTKLNIGRNFGIPLMVMYKDGKLINHYQGAVEEEFLESDIKQALGK
jgi:thiol-disulfide isomerase/thioredoxin